MSKNAEQVKKWRQVTKQRMVDAFDGKCGICGYNKCRDALDFHHVDPNEKEFGIATITASWKKIVNELRKCICVCSNCHREIHNGISKIPETVKRFNEKFATFYIDKHEMLYDKCICGKKKKIKNRFCSLNCASFFRRKIDWDKVDLYKLLVIEKKSYVDIGELLGISDNSVSKRAIKIGLKSSFIKD